MKLYGLTGYPLSHSFSADYFHKKFSEENVRDAEYRLFPLKDITKLGELILQNPSLLGLNVTIPYKEDIIKYIDVLQNPADKIKAVNTIKIIRKDSANYRLVGYNTDIYGFGGIIKPLRKKIGNSKALILGNGGAAKAVAYVLDEMGIDYKYVSRMPQRENYISYNKLDKNIISSHHLIVNATPVGMYPRINTKPDIPYEYITEKHLLVDLIYNPEETLFLRYGKDKGAATENGLQMLRLQADKAWEIWNE